MTTGPLSSTPTYVHGFTRSDGTVVKPHLAKRKRKIETTHDPRQAGIPLPSSSPLNEFLSKHGGSGHVKTSLEAMTPEHRAKLIDAMAALGGVEPKDVIEKLGMSEPEKKEPEPTATADEPVAKKHEIVEHVTRKGRTLRGVIRTDLSLDEAKKIDEYTFRKNGGFFIREKHLVTAEALDQARAKGVITEPEHEKAREASAHGGPEAVAEVLKPEVGNTAEKPEAIDFEEYAAKRGASRLGFGDAGLHKTSKNVSEAAKRSALKNQQEKDSELSDERARLQAEYDAAVKDGKIRPKTNVERMIDTARGHPDKESVQAARRVLEKRGIDWREAAEPEPAPEPEKPAESTPEPEPAADEPKDGDTKTEDGVEYVLRDGRWHRDTPEQESAKEPASEEPAEQKPEPKQEDAKTEKLAKPSESEGDDLDPSSPNYRYRDTGYIAGSRKEMAAQMIRKMSRRGEPVRSTDIDWEQIEQNPREAKELITKANLFGSVDPMALRDAGVDPGAGFLIGKVYAAIPTAPDKDTEQSRRDYAVALDTLRDRIGACKTSQQVTDTLDEIKAERSGVMLNDREQGLYDRTMVMLQAEMAVTRKIKEGSEVLFKEMNGIYNDLETARWEQRKRKDRGWADKPELDRQVEELTAAETKARDAAIQYGKDNGMEAIKHETKTETGVSVQFEYPYLAKQRKLEQALRDIRSAAQMRNVFENPLTRAWMSLGEDFMSVLNYRSHRGSKAFANHVATAKAGRIKDWSWAEKKNEPRKSTQQSVTFQLRVADNFEREGGREVKVDSTGALKKTFNLRDVQSGNWVLDDPNSAKFHVEACAGGFADLADLLGVADENVSFNGRLAMAFGARGKGGKGAAKAHYEPVQRAINLTKMAGGGSLAHEWFHAVDNLISEATTGVASGAEDFATLSPKILDNPELKTAFQGLVTAMMEGPHRHVETLVYTEAEERWTKSNMSYSYGNIRGEIQAAKTAQDAVDAVEQTYARGGFGNPEKKKSKTQRDNWRKIALIHKAGNAERKIEYATGRGMSSYLLEAKNLDNGVSGKYWSAPHEMAARAFSSFVEDRLAERGKKNTYLVSMANNEVYRRLGEPHRPFPDGEERQRVNQAMEKVFALIAKDNILAKALDATFG